MRFLALATLLTGCFSSTADEQTQGDLFTPSPSWVHSLYETPELFSSAVEPDRNGWIALHRGDWVSALDSNNSAVQYRAHASLASFYRRLSRISFHTWARMETIWGERPEMTVAPQLQAAAQLARVNTLASAESASAMSELPPSLLSMAKETLALDRSSLTQRAQNAAFELPDKGIAIQDPLVFQGLTRHHQESIQTRTPPVGMESVLFSSCAEAIAPTTETDPHSFRCEGDALVQQAGMDAGVLDSEDNAQRAREFGRGLDAHLADWNQHMESRNNSAGQQLLTDLQLVDIYRAQTLLALAEEALNAERPRQALSLAQMAQDMRSPREIGPINTPLLFAVLAEANLLTGRYREALEPLEILARAFPEVQGLDESVGDLSVLNNLNRRGDSKEL